MAKLEFWFPTVIYLEENLFSEEINKKWAEQIHKIAEQNPSGGDEWEGKTYTTHNAYRLIDDLNFKSLIETVTEHVHEYAKEHNSIAEYKCSDAWVNIAKSENFQEYHTHDGSVFSAVYYVASPEGSGNIVFEDPRMPDMLPVKNIPERNSLSFVKVGYKTQGGMLVIFRSYLRHCVQTGSNKEPRISIAMNFGYA